MRQCTLLGKIPLIVSKWEDFDNNKQIIIETCLKSEIPNTIESNIAVGAKSNLWESSFDFLEKQPDINDLKLWLIQESTALINNFNNTSYRAAITESWAHVTRHGGYHKPHHHSGSTWSGIFYVESELNKGGSNTWYLPFYMERKLGLEFADATYTINHSPGNLVLFPSMLLHDADVYWGTQPRIVISFNLICL